MGRESENEELRDKEYLREKREREKKETLRRNYSQNTQNLNKISLK